MKEVFASSASLFGELREMFADSLQCRQKPSIPIPVLWKLYLRAAEGAEIATQRLDDLLAVVRVNAAAAIADINQVINPSAHLNERRQGRRVLKLHPPTVYRNRLLRPAATDVISGAIVKQSVVFGIAV